MSTVVENVLVWHNDVLDFWHVRTVCVRYLTQLIIINQSSSKTQMRKSTKNLPAADKLLFILINITKISYLVFDAYNFTQEKA
jgi:hypothetical protein